jgi:methionyl-tRNA formyltransferase
MKILLIGAVDFSESVLKKLISMKSEIVGVCTLKNSIINSDHCDLSNLCKQKKIKWIFSEDINSSEVVKWIKMRKPDIIFCCGWSRLLKKNVLNIPRLGVIGYHPSKLPFNRGRHPLVWALALGLNKTASTFFIMKEDADSGDIISQKDITITKNDDASSLYSKMTKVAMTQINEFLPDLKIGSLKQKKQNNNFSNSWRKRSILDGLIDWRMTADSIYNLVRSLSRPYIGAHFISDGKEFKIWKVKIIKLKEPNIEPGKIIRINSELLVKCGDNAIKIIEIDPLFKFTEGDYL